MPVAGSCRIQSMKTIGVSGLQVGSLAKVNESRPAYTTRPAGVGEVGEAGFEPAKAAPPDLQSGPFGRSGIPPRSRLASELTGAGS